MERFRPLNPPSNSANNQNVVEGGTSPQYLEVIVSAFLFTEFTLISLYLEGSMPFIVGIFLPIWIMLAIAFKNFIDNLSDFDTIDEIS